MGRRCCWRRRGLVAACLGTAFLLLCTAPRALRLGEWFHLPTPDHLQPDLWRGLRGTFLLLPGWGAGMVVERLVGPRKSWKCARPSKDLGPPPILWER